MGRLRTIVVDLEPVLPGAENGGAKIFALTLIRQLASDHPDVRFILLTQPASHQELASLEAANVCRYPLRVASHRRGGWIRLRKALPRWHPLRGAFAAVYSGLYRSWVRWGRRPRHGLLEDLKADLLFAPFTTSRFKTPPVPMVSVIYDLQHKTYPQFFPDTEVAHRHRMLEEACRFSAAIAVISDYVRDTVLGEEMIEPDRIKSIHIRMPHRFPSLAAPEQADVLARLGLVRQSYLLYPANFWPHKNHEMLLVAFLAARRSGLSSQIKLVFTGAPSGRMDELMRTVRAFGLADDVQFLGFLDEHAFQAVLNGAIGLVFPSLYEGFGMPVVEAMAAGCPVACSAGTSLREVAEGAALTFDPRKPDDIARAMVELCGNERLRSELVAKGRRRAEAFSQTPQMAREYWAMFETALDRAPHREAVYGLYADGWASPDLAVEYGSGSAGRAVEIEFFAPAFLPIVWNTIEIADVGGKVIETTWVDSGQTQTVSIPIGAEHGQLRIRFRYFVRPAEILPGDDMREICAMVRHVAVHEAGATRVLFGNPRAALEGVQPERAA